MKRADAGKGGIRKVWGEVAVLCQVGCQLVQILRLLSDFTDVSHVQSASCAHSHPWSSLEVKSSAS